jgi:hypothetical protein
MEEEGFEIKWVTYNFISHPFGDLVWHLITGFFAGAFILYSVLTSDYWAMVVGILSFIFFFHPVFYDPKLMEIKINNEGITVDGKLYEWHEFDGFEIFSSHLRDYVYLVPHSRFKMGFDIPIEDFFVDKEEVRKKLNIYLDEYKNIVPPLHQFFRAIFP